ncbi:hypothetical protein [Streptomyces nigrescens]|uniref:hypothetical protein n=1 Tax=Streptomyces nigrescens TaxID=1920 RepID=UPI0036FB5F27
MSDSKAMNLRFRDERQHEAIAAAAKNDGVSIQEYVISAAYERATAVERHFLDAFQRSVARSSEAFAAEPSTIDPTPEQRAAELMARKDLENDGRGRAA